MQGALTHESELQSLGAYYIGPNANLQGADLRETDLQGANLENANLHGANLEDAHLEEANLQGADLREANLENANLEYAKYDERTDFEGSEITQEQLDSMDYVEDEDGELQN